jgi:hypothetical protein
MISTLFGQLFLTRVKRRLYLLSWGVSDASNQISNNLDNDNLK